MIAPRTVQRTNGAAAGGHARGRVLVADDIEENRSLIRDLLERENLQVEEAEDGLVALERIALARPDVVLLDLQMPRMDGFETCRRLKENPETASIPVLLVTALHEREHRLAGIGAGANDFITKPVDGADLILRVRNALHTHRLYAELDRKYAELTRLERLRDDLVHMLVHDLRSPLSALSLTLQLVVEDLEADSPIRSDITAAARCTRDVADMIDDVLDTSRMEADQLPLDRRPVDLREVCREAIRRVGGSDAASVVLETPEDRAVAHVDRKILERVVGNLVDNALKYHRGAEPPRVRVQRVGERIRVSVHDRGLGVPPEARARIFEKFGQAGQAPGARRSTGLGLTFSKLAIDTHGGEIGVEDRAGGGSTFWFEIATHGPREAGGGTN